MGLAGWDVGVSGCINANVKIIISWEYGTRKNIDLVTDSMSALGLEH